MGRKDENTASYFPFVAKDGRTLFLLQNKFGLEGIGFFTNLMRLLCVTPGHYLDLSEESDRLYAYSKIGVDAEKADAMFGLMAITGKIHKKLWEERSVVYSKDFVKSLEDLYKKRKVEPISLEQVLVKYQLSDESGAEITRGSDNRSGNIDKEQFPEKTGAEMPVESDSRRGNASKDRIVKDRIVEDRKGENTGDDFGDDRASSADESPSAALSRQKKTKTEMSQKDKEFYHLIQGSFEAISGPFADYKREGQAIKRIMAYSSRASPNPVEFARKMLFVFRRLSESQDKFWSSQPFLPSILASGGIWPRVEKEVGKEEGKFEGIDESTVEAAMAAIGASRR